jgi:hypothetical protein
VKADRARLLLVAAAGIVLAHAADYALAFPDPARRGRVLSATGHGYWPVAVVVAVLCAALGFAVAARRGWRGETHATSVRATAARLAVGQVALFGVLETVERAAVGAHPVAFLASTQFAVGVVLQIAVALVAAVLLRGVEHGARRLASSLRRHRRADSGRPAWNRPLDDLVVVRWWGVAGDARAPPLTLPA